MKHKRDGRIKRRLNEGKFSLAKIKATLRWMDGCLIEFLRSRTAVAARLAKEIRAPFKSDNGFLLQHDISSSLSVREKKLSDMSAQSETREDQVLQKIMVVS